MEDGSNEQPSASGKLESHIWFGTLPERDSSSLLEMAKTISPDKFKDNNGKDTGFDNEPSFEVTTKKRRKVNFQN